MEHISKRIDLLESLLDNLVGSSRKFAESLISGQWGYRTWVSKGMPSRFSEKQRGCVEQLIAKAEGYATAVSDATADVGNMSGLIEIFQKAKEKLKWPKIRLEVNGNPVVLKIAGEKSKYTGEIMVTDGGPFGANRYYGRVSREGRWVKPNRDFLELGDVGTLLENMAANPAKTASEYGKLTGQCCFCNKALDDSRSTAVGYGPVCAKHYGLPWGENA
jgi:hypothetical protein